MLLDYGDGMLWKGKKFFDYTGIFRFINYFYTVYYFIRQIYAAIVIDFVPNVTNRPYQQTGSGSLRMDYFFSIFFFNCSSTFLAF